MSTIHHLIGNISTSVNNNQHQNIANRFVKNRYPILVKYSYLLFYSSNLTTACNNHTTLPTTTVIHQEKHIATPIQRFKISQSTTYIYMQRWFHLHLFTLFPLYFHFQRNELCCLKTINVGCSLSQSARNR